MFQQRGYVKVRMGDDMEALLDHVLNICAIDFAEWNEGAGQRGVEVSPGSNSRWTCVSFEDVFLQLVCTPEDLGKVMKAIADFASTSPLCEVLTSEVNWAPLEPQEVGEEAEEMDRLDDLVEALEGNDDVERVYTTLEPNHLIADIS